MASANLPPFFFSFSHDILHQSYPSFVMTLKYFKKIQAPCYRDKNLKKERMDEPDGCDRITRLPGGSRSFNCLNILIYSLAIPLT